MTTAIFLQEIFLHKEGLISTLVYYIRLVKMLIRLQSCLNMSHSSDVLRCNSPTQTYDSIMYLQHINVDLGTQWFP